MRKLGIAFRQEFKNHLEFSPVKIDCVEFTAEHFFYRRHRNLLIKISGQFPSTLHSIGLSIGSPDSTYFNDNSWRIQELKELIRVTKPNLVTDHFAFTRHADRDLGHLNPIPFSKSCLDLITERALELNRFFQAPLAFENITRFSTLSGDLEEPDFINQFCNRTGCGLLLDLTNLYVNSRNLDFDPLQWLTEIDLRFVKQVHVAGVTQGEFLLLDAHADPVDNQLKPLLTWLDYQGVKAPIVLERDENLSDLNSYFGDLKLIQSMGIDDLQSGG